MAQGTIRTRCKVCRKAGLVEKECKTHKERVYNALFPGPDGRQISKTLLTKGDADKWLAKTATELNEGVYRSIQPRKTKELCEQYLAGQRGNLRPAVYTGYKNYVLRFQNTFGELPISRVNGKMLTDFLAKNYEHNGFWHRKKAQQHIKAIFKIAELDGAIKDNPTKILKNVRNTTKREAYPYLSRERVKELVDVSGDPMVHLYYKMAIFTGMRPNELCGLARKSIDLDKKQIKVEQTVYYFKTKEERGGHNEPFKFQGCKSHAGYRILPIGKDLLADLEIYLINSPENRHNLLFARGNGDPVHHDHNIVKKHFNGHIAALHRRTEFPKIEFYDLRHTFASILFEMKINLKKVQYLMGHEDFETTANLYARLFGKAIEEDEEFMGVADQMERFLGGSKLASKDPIRV